MPEGKVINFVRTIFPEFPDKLIEHSVQLERLSQEDRRAFIEAFRNKARPDDTFELVLEFLNRSRLLEDHYAIDLEEQKYLFQVAYEIAEANTKEYPISPNGHGQIIRLFREFNFDTRLFSYQNEILERHFELALEKVIKADKEYLLSLNTEFLICVGWLHKLKLIEALGYEICKDTAKARAKILGCMIRSAARVNDSSYQKNVLLRAKNYLDEMVADGIWGSGPYVSARDLAQQFHEIELFAEALYLLNKIEKLHGELNSMDYELRESCSHSLDN